MQEISPNRWSLFGVVEIYLSRARVSKKTQDVSRKEIVHWSVATCDSLICNGCILRELLAQWLGIV